MAKKYHKRKVNAAYLYVAKIKILTQIGLPNEHMCRICSFIIFFKTKMHVVIHVETYPDFQRSTGMVEMSERYKLLSALF